MKVYIAIDHSGNPVRIFAHNQIPVDAICLAPEGNYEDCDLTISEDGTVFVDPDKVAQRLLALAEHPQQE